MKKNFFRRLIAIILVGVLTLSMNAFAFASEKNTYAQENMARASYETLLTTNITRFEKIAYFYVPSTSNLGNTYYITFSGDSGYYVNFSVYYSNGSSPIWSGSYLANGTTYTKRLSILPGEYRIAMNTGSSNSILCVVGYQR